jgi:hypothetical protein
VGGLTACAYPMPFIMQNRTLYFKVRLSAWLRVAVLLALLFSCAKNSSYWKVINTVRSPNGDYDATIYAVSWGGAAGGCEQRMEINTRNNPFNMERAKKEADFCFSASCGSKVEMLWESNSSALQIKYTIGDGGVSTYQRRMAPNLPVRIDYIAQ